MYLNFEHNLGQKYHRSRDVDRWTFVFVFCLKKNIIQLRSCQAMSEVPLKCPLGQHYWIEFIEFNSLAVSEHRRLTTMRRILQTARSKCYMEKSSCFRKQHILESSWNCAAPDHTSRNTCERRYASYCHKCEICLVTWAINLTILISHSTLLQPNFIARCWACWAI